MKRRTDKTGCVFKLVALATIVHAVLRESHGSLGFRQDSVLGHASSVATSVLPMLRHSLCQGGLGVARLLWMVPGADKLVVEALVVRCIEYNIRKLEVCRKAVGIFDEQAFAVINHLLGNGTRLCHPGFKMFQDWEVEVPGRPDDRPRTPPKWDEREGAPVEKIVHITDIHLDHNYHEGSPSSCLEPLCCWKNSTASDGAPGRTGLSGKFGAPTCDSPRILVDTFVEYIRRNVDSNIVYWTGDADAHDDWVSSRNIKKRAIRTVYGLLRESFPSMRIFPVIGNHESFPLGSFPSQNVDHLSPTKWLYQMVADQSKHWLDGPALSTLRRGGFYTMRVMPGLRVVALNSNFCDSFNMWMVIDNRDPYGQLAWLVETLTLAEESGEKVHLLMHHPFGESDCNPVWARNLNRIISRFSDVVSCVFAGHVHRHIYNVIFDSAEAVVPQNILYSGPSLTPYQHFDPAFSVYHVDPSPSSHHTVVDIETHVMDLSKSNKLGRPEWAVRSSTKKYFNLKNLSPDSWANLTELMTKNETLFQDFLRFRNNRRGHVVTTPRRDIICELVRNVKNDERPCARIVGASGA